VNAAVTLVGLLGDTRAQVVDVLRRGAASVADLAEALDLSEVAVRRHVQILEREGLVDAQTVRHGGRGRPGASYSLTDKGRRLFPDRSGELATELLDFLVEQHGRSALRSFLQWRVRRQEARYGAAVATAGEDPAARAAALADVLSQDGFLADVAEVEGPGGRVQLRLTQHHCAIQAVAEAHPELCAYEAALFQDVLGARVSRRETLAGGAPACVCTINCETTKHQGRA
jgi:predicted ArsR family transcriptional regulator